MIALKSRLCSVLLWGRDEGSIPLQTWLIYIIEASDGSLYTGITTDMARRWGEHSSGKGARFFRGRSPRQLVYLEASADRGSATQREMAIKRLTRPHKERLIASVDNELEILRDQAMGVDQ